MRAVRRLRGYGEAALAQLPGDGLLAGEAPGARGAGRGGPRRRAGPPAPGLAPGAPGCLGQARPLGLTSKNLVGTAPLVDSQVV